MIPRKALNIPNAPIINGVKILKLKRNAINLLYHFVESSLTIRKVKIKQMAENAVKSFFFNLSPPSKLSSVLLKKVTRFFA